MFALSHIPHIAPTIKTLVAIMYDFEPTHLYHRHIEVVRFPLQACGTMAQYLQGFGRLADEANYDLPIDTLSHETIWKLQGSECLSS
jgi:hypothetical protein